MLDYVASYSYSSIEKNGSLLLLKILITYLDSRLIGFQIANNWPSDHMHLKALYAILASDSTTLEILVSSKIANNDDAISATYQCKANI